MILCWAKATTDSEQCVSACILDVGAGQESWVCKLCALCHIEVHSPICCNHWILHDILGYGTNEHGGHVDAVLCRAVTIGLAGSCRAGCRCGCSCCSFVESGPALESQQSRQDLGSEVWSVLASACVLCMGCLLQHLMNRMGMSKGARRVLLTCSGNAAYHSPHLCALQRYICKRLQAWCIVQRLGWLQERRSSHQQTRSCSVVVSCCPMC